MRSHRFTVALCLACASVATAETFSGSLSTTTGGISGVSGWIDPGPTTLTWEITDMDTFFHYSYTLSVSGGDISHFVIEVSENFTEDDYWNASGPFEGSFIDDYGQHNGNPDIPEMFHGLKFDDMVGLTATIEFDSSRMPVWGDFYAKGGGNPNKQAWNTGFVDADPADLPSNGSINFHALVPDSVVPEPASLLLLGVGALLLRRR